MPAEREPIDPKLIAWAEHETGGRVTATRIATSGFARLTAILELEGCALRSAVLRHDTGAGALAGTPFSLAHEAIAYRATAGRGLAVPRLLAAARDGRTLLLEKADGNVANGHEALGDLLRQLGTLHALPVAALPLEGFTARGQHDLDGWEAIYRTRVTRTIPLLELAFAILRDNSPGATGITVFCHGDPGAGNYLVADNRVSALLDWELSHLGDPMDDLAWLSIRASQFGLSIENFAGLVATHWSPASGMEADARRLRYWQGVGLLRMLVMCLANTTQPRKGRERLMHLMIEPVFENQLIAALAGLTGTTLPPPAPPSPAELMAAFPAEDISEAAEDVSEQVLPLTAGLPIDPWIRRIRQLLRQVGERGHAFAATSAGAFDTADTASLQDFDRHSCARLAWLPKSAALAARPLADFAPPPDDRAQRTSS